MVDYEQNLTNKNFLIAPTITTEHLPHPDEFYKACERFYSSERWIQTEERLRQKSEGTVMKPGELRRALPLLGALADCRDLIGQEPAEFSPETTKPYMVVKASMNDAACYSDLYTSGQREPTKIIRDFPTQPVAKAQAFSDALQSTPDDPVKGWKMIQEDRGHVLTKNDDELKLRRDPAVFEQGKGLLDCLMEQPAAIVQRRLYQVSAVYNPETSHNGTRLQGRAGFSLITQNGEYTFYHLSVGEEILDFPYTFSAVVRYLLAGQTLDLYCKNDMFKYNNGEAYINKMPWEKVKTILPERSDYVLLLINYYQGTAQQREVRPDLAKDGRLIKQLWGLFRDMLIAYKKEVSDYRKTGKLPEALMHHTTSMFLVPVYPNDKGGRTLDLSYLPPSAPKPEATYHGQLYRPGEVQSAKATCPNFRSCNEPGCNVEKEITITKTVSIDANGRGVVYEEGTCNVFKKKKIPVSTKLLRRDQILQD